MMFLGIIKSDVQNITKFGSKFGPPELKFILQSIWLKIGTCFFFISMTAISMMRLRFCQNEFAKSSYLPKYKSHEETNCTVIKGFQN